MAAPEPEPEPEQKDESYASSVYSLGVGDWLQVAKLTASDGNKYDLFGSAVGISGHLVVVGAHQPKFGSWSASSGSVYIFGRNTDGTWSEVVKLTADDAASGDEFGGAVAISAKSDQYPDRDYVVVGACGDNPTGTGSSSDYGCRGIGSAYLFEANAEGAWSQLAKLTAGDAAANDVFGKSVAISGDFYGDYILVGAPGDDCANFEDSDSGDSDSPHLNTINCGSVSVYSRLNNATSYPTTKPTEAPTKVPTSAPTHPLCQAGEYSPDRTGDFCVACEKGRFTNRNGSYSCDGCPINHYQDKEGSTNCSRCETGYFAGIGSPSCSFCRNGQEQFLNYDNGELECGPCATGRYSPLGLFCTDCGNGSFTEDGVDPRRNRKRRRPGE